MGSWCSGAIALCPLACVVGAVATVAPQGCGSRVLMYTGLGQGGFGDRKQTTRKPANTKPARRARVETGTASNRLATPCCPTPADDHINEANRHSTITQLTNQH